MMTEGVGRTHLTTYSQSNTSEHGHPHRRCNCSPNPIHVVRVYQWKETDDGLGANTAIKITASMQQSLHS
jgi:hypothetical protein